MLKLNICGSGTNVAEDVYVDDFVLTVKAGSEPDQPDQPDQPDEPDEPDEDAPDGDDEE